MENNDLVNVNEEIVETEETEEIPERSGIGTGWAMLIGSGLTLAAIAAGKKAKKVWADHKAKKELKDDPGVIDHEEFMTEQPNVTGDEPEE